VNNSFFIWLNVINAILIRDVKIRSGLYYIGYIFIFLMPFFHLIILNIAFDLLGRSTPFGLNRFAYFGISILPFVIFIYPSQQIMRSLSSNIPLLYFSRVKLIDIIFARGALEFLNGISVCVFIALILNFFAFDFQPERPFNFLIALIATLYFGFAMGAINATISQIFPMWMYVIIVLYPAIWLSSGIIFFPHAVPDMYKIFLRLNPMLGCIEYARYSYFFDYPSEFADLKPALFSGSIILSVTFFIDRVWRRILIT